MMDFSDQIRQMEEYFLSEEYLELSQAEKIVLVSVLDAVKVLQYYDSNDLLGKQSAPLVEPLEETEAGEVCLSFLTLAIRGIMGQFEGRSLEYKIYQTNRYVDRAMKDVCKENGTNNPKPDIPR